MNIFRDCSRLIIRVNSCQDKLATYQLSVISYQLSRQFQKNKIPKTTTRLYAYKSYVTNCLLTLRAE
ncbi:MAG: hypothetical protein VSS75_007365, partial [Candidatus Parabeggiatoa sp.]|nr:hypothetical protein [Candidatus Parabeggiatoa sp.]